jgi:hypothetical protein
MLRELQGKWGGVVQQAAPVAPVGASGLQDRQSDPTRELLSAMDIVMGQGRDTGVTHLGRLRMDIGRNEQLLRFRAT